VGNSIGRLLGGSVSKSAGGTAPAALSVLPGALEMGQGLFLPGESGGIAVSVQGTWAVTQSPEAVTLSHKSAAL